MSTELPKHAAICALETGLEVEADGETVKLRTAPGAPDKPAIAYAELSPYQARLLADALQEAASNVEGNGLSPEKTP